MNEFYDRFDSWTDDTKRERSFKFRSYKVYPHSRGLSCAFRNTALAPSHCAQVHGYSLSVKLGFEATTLDNNIVVDFGDLKSFWNRLQDLFDHTTIIAEDDPEMAKFLELEKSGVVALRVLPAVGCEAFSYTVYKMLERWLIDCKYDYVRPLFAEVWEHESNGAGYGQY